jgi:simple sugar transport system ATP-binding protein
VVLDVRDLTVPGRSAGKNAVQDVSFSVRRGEIVCIAGIDGNGQSELVFGLTGLARPSCGSIFLDGKDITRSSVRDRTREGIGHIPEDRLKYGLVLEYSLEENLVLQRYYEPQFRDSIGRLRRNEIRRYAEKLIEEYDVRSGQGPETVVRTMSGGNQQKAVFAREIDRDPSLLIAVQPTRGVDVGAIENIHQELVRQRDAGKAVLLVSLELDEVMDVPDRILVLCEGRIAGEFVPGEVTMEELGMYMTGAKKQEKYAGPGRRPKPAADKEEKESGHRTASKGEAEQ